MSQLGRKGVPVPLCPLRRTRGPGTFEDVAGFRIGRGRNNGAPQARPHTPPYGQQAPQGDPSYGYPQAPQRPQYGGGQPYGAQGGPGGPGGQSGWPQASGGNHGEPEYFGDGGGQGYPQGPGQGHQPYAANNP